MLKNTEKETWHPIFYFESPLPGQESKSDLIRFKSKGHHTSGFKNFGDAMVEAVSVETRLKSQGYSVFSEVEPLLLWDGTETPVDTELKSLEQLTNNANKTKGHRPDTV